MIVAAQMIFLQLISVISFSNDMGRTWHKYTFTDERIHVDGLLTEPGEYTHKFTLFGHRNYRDHWKLFALDLAPLVARNCTYPDDYVNVSFARNTQNSNQCHLGMRQTFEQLKEGNCLVGSEYKRVTTTELCPCTDIDYECGYGYITTSSGCKKVVGKGSPIDDIRDILDEDTTPTIPPCVNGLRKMPTQYRKVPGDQCQNDLEGKLFTIVNCSIVVTPPPPPTIHVKLLNKTNEVKIGEVLHFTAVSNSETVWSVIRTAEPKDKITTRPVKRDEISLN
uniref:Sortilin C-terminal domain-containing protein n=1 Tax=Ciona intestinalis TaxID=7719 RepID=F6ZL50_CIOIN